MTSNQRVALACVVGTTIEFYDFYVFGTASALIIGTVFFPPAAGELQQLNAFLTFALAFVARPFGAFLFGHYGDRVGRKSTLVASLLLMGISTFLIGLLPSFAAAGWLAPGLLCLMRLGQGIGLGGEWGGAALLATENAPPGKRGWFGMFPQMGPPLGFILANGLFLLLTAVQTPAQFIAWGWRIPFLVSAVLVAFGLYVRVSLTETAAFTRVQTHKAEARMPIIEVLRHHMGTVMLGSCAIIMAYTLFYICTLFAIRYLTGTRGLPNHQVLGLLCLAITGMAIATPIAGWLIDRFGRRKVLALSAVVIMGIGALLPAALASPSLSTLFAFLFAALFMMGMSFGPMGALLPEIFPTRVRYTGAAMAYNIGGILGGSLTPYVAQRLQSTYGLYGVGWFLIASACISLGAIAIMRETATIDLQDDATAAILP